MTLVEVTVSTLLVGLLMVASLSSLGNISKTWVSATQQTDGQELAQQLMKEIISQFYSDPTMPTNWGRESGETRRIEFDDIDDYVGWNESPVADSSGNAITGFAGWSRSVTIEKLDPSYAVNPPNSTDKGLRRITVVVTSPASKTTTLVAFRSSVAGQLQNVSADTTAVTWVGVSLKLGNNSMTSGGTSIGNHAEDQ
ncbi:MAG: hypothetical protein FJ267_20565 [Planctomycetes bacterium]|nr:hypothetical protein [Planctomycetota bacterium]